MSVQLSAVRVGLRKETTVWQSSLLLHAGPQPKGETLLVGVITNPAVLPFPRSGAAPGVLVRPFRDDRGPVHGT